MLYDKKKKKRYNKIYSGKKHDQSDITIIIIKSIILLFILVGIKLIRMPANVGLSVLSGGIWKNPFLSARLVLCTPLPPLTHITCPVPGSRSRRTVSREYLIDLYLPSTISSLGVHFNLVRPSPRRRPCLQLFGFHTDTRSRRRIFSRTRNRLFTTAVRSVPHSAIFRHLFSIVL